VVAACEAARVPLLGSSLTTADFIVAVTGWLGDRLAPHTEIHGVLLDVLGIGVLVLGKSGIGKSETALDLVVRGHRLVADDVVRLWCKSNAVFGAGAKVIRHHMEIRGLGIINIKDLFGIAAVRETKKIELVVELVEWADGDDYDRLGIDDRSGEQLGIPLPHLRLPVRPGRNLATLIEVAARDQLLKAQGHHSARELVDELRRRMQEQQHETTEEADAVE
jgi:HPr kinase/phosphorylase